ncbi:hypothetical protein DOY81_002652 [Sarcophaga bullata]|nr:hypothetical protein DOY81_002652 [Sarcophaga bullata]
MKNLVNGKAFVVVALRISSQSTTAGRRAQFNTPLLLQQQQTHQHLEIKECEDELEEESDIEQGFFNRARRKVAR